VQLREHRHNLQQGLLEKSKLAQHAYEEGHEVGWGDARVLEIESNSRYRKYKESVQKPSNSVCYIPSSEPFRLYHLRSLRIKFTEVHSASKPQTANSLFSNP
jgi:hypothetical protein